MGRSVEGGAARIRECPKASAARRLLYQFSAGRNYPADASWGAFRRMHDMAAGIL